MSSSFRMPYFSEVTHTLERLSAPTQAAEAHGLLSGFVCAGQSADGKTWLEPIFGHSSEDVLDEDKMLLVNLYDHTCRQLNGVGFEFVLFLPDSEEPLMKRAKALSDWCRGFLSGLGLAGLQLIDNMEETHDALRRFLEISRLDHNHIDVTDEDEKAFVEISEYVRVAVVMIYDELAAIYQSCMKEKQDGRLH